MQLSDNSALNEYEKYNIGTGENEGKAYTFGVDGYPSK